MSQDSAPYWKPPSPEPNSRPNVFNPTRSSVSTVSPPAQSSRPDEFATPHPLNPGVPNAHASAPYQTRRNTNSGDSQHHATPSTPHPSSPDIPDRYPRTPHPQRDTNSGGLQYHITASSAPYSSGPGSTSRFNPPRVGLQQRSASSGYSKQNFPELSTPHFYDSLHRRSTGSAYSEPSSEISASSGSNTTFPPRRAEDHQRPPQLYTASSSSFGQPTKFSQTIHTPQVSNLPPQRYNHQLRSPSTLYPIILNTDNESRETRPNYIEQRESFQISPTASPYGPPSTPYSYSDQGESAPLPVTPSNLLPVENVMATGRKGQPSGKAPGKRSAPQKDDADFEPEGARTTKKQKKEASIAAEAANWNRDPPELRRRAGRPPQGAYAEDPESPTKAKIDPFSKVQEISDDEVTEKAPEKKTSTGARLKSGTGNSKSAFHNAVVDITSEDEIAAVPEQMLSSGNRNNKSMIAPSSQAKQKGKERQDEQSPMTKAASDKKEKARIAEERKQVREEQKRLADEEKKRVAEANYKANEERRLAKEEEKRLAREEKSRLAEEKKLANDAKKRADAEEKRQIEEAKKQSVKEAKAKAAAEKQAEKDAAKAGRNKKANAAPALDLGNFFPSEKFKFPRYNTGEVYIEMKRESLKHSYLFERNTLTRVSPWFTESFEQDVAELDVGKSIKFRNDNGVEFRFEFSYDTDVHFWKLKRVPWVKLQDDKVARQDQLAIWKDLTSANSSLYALEYPRDTTPQDNEWVKDTLAKHGAPFTLKRESMKTGSPFGFDGTADDGLPRTVETTNLATLQESHVKIQSGINGGPDSVPGADTEMPDSVPDSPADHLALSSSSMSEQVNDAQTDVLPQTMATEVKLEMEIAPSMIPNTDTELSGSWSNSFADEFVDRGLELSIASSDEQLGDYNDTSMQDVTIDDQLQVDEHASGAPISSHDSLFGDNADARFPTSAAQSLKIENEAPEISYVTSGDEGDYHMAEHQFVVGSPEGTHSSQSQTDSRDYNAEISTSSTSGAMAQSKPIPFVHDDNSNDKNASTEPVTPLAAGEPRSPHPVLAQPLNSPQSTNSPGHADDVADVVSLVDIKTSDTEVAVSGNIISHDDQTIETDRDKMTAGLEMGFFQPPSAPQRNDHGLDAQTILASTGQSHATTDFPASTKDSEDLRERKSVRHKGGNVLPRADRGHETGNLYSSPGSWSENHNLSPSRTTHGSTPVNNSSPKDLKKPSVEVIYVGDSDDEDEPSTPIASSPIMNKKSALLASPSPLSQQLLPILVDSYSSCDIPYDEDTFVPQEVYKAYDNVFRIMHNLPPKLDINSIDASFRQIQIMLRVAGQFESLDIIRPYATFHLLDFGKVLFKSVQKDPPRWLQLSLSLQSAPIFQEAMVHIVGQHDDHFDNEWPWTSINIDAFQPSIRKLIKDKATENKAIRQEVDIELYSNNIVYKGKPLTLIPGRTEESRDAWFVVQYWRDWFYCQRAASSPNRSYLKSHPYMMIALSGDSYLSLDNTHVMLHELRDSQATREEVQQYLDILKDFAAETVKPLTVNNSMLQYQEMDIDYLTCTLIAKHEFPWNAQSAK